MSERATEEARKRYEAETRKPADQPAAGEGKPPRDWQSLIEERIRELDLDNLPGKGKPLDLSANPYARPEDELANRVLRNAGFTLPWIDERKAIEARLEAARVKLRQSREVYEAQRDEQICAGHQWVEGSWQAALREFRQEIEAINRDIRDYNLKVTVPGLQRFTVLLDEELARVGVSNDEG